METVPPPLPHIEINDGPRSRWPAVLGVISMIYAIGGLMCQVLGGLWIGLGSQVPEMFRGGMEMPAVVRIQGCVSAVLGLALGILMLVGAIRLLRRQRIGARLLRRWVILRLSLLALALAASLLTLPAQVQMQRSVERYMQRKHAEDPTSPMFQVPPKRSDEQWTRHLALQNVIATAVFSLYPIFLGTWLTRRKILDEVTTWE